MVRWSLNPPGRWAKSVSIRIKSTKSKSGVIGRPMAIIIKISYPNRGWQHPNILLGIINRVSFVDCVMNRNNQLNDHFERQIGKHFVLLAGKFN